MRIKLTISPAWPRSERLNSFGHGRHSQVGKSFLALSTKKPSCADLVESIETHKIRIGPAPCGRARKGARLRGNAESKLEKCDESREARPGSARSPCLAPAACCSARPSVLTCAVSIQPLRLFFAYGRRWNAARPWLTSRYHAPCSSSINSSWPVRALQRSYRVLRSTLKSNSTSPISIYIENLDLGRFGGSNFKHAVQSYFREKYKDTPIGIVLPIGSAALELVLDLRPQLWPETPVIFAAVDEGVPDRLTLPSKVTGTTMPAPLSDFGLRCADDRARPQAHSNRG